MSNKTKKVGILLMVALCAATFIAMGDMIIIPAADFLYDGSMDFGVANFILSGPALISAIMNIFSGKLIKMMGARRFLLVTFCFFLVGAIISCVSQTGIALVVARTLEGISMGALAVVSVVIISMHFTDEGKRGTMIGFYNTSMSIWGMILGIAAGAVAATGWTNIFYMYLISIPIFVLLFFFVPKDVEANDGEEAAEPAQGEAAAEAEAEGESKMPWGLVIRVAIANFVIGALYCILYYQIAVVAADHGITDTVFAGTLSSLGTAGSFVGTLAFGFYFQKLKRFTAPVAYGLVAIMFVVFYLSGSEIAFAIAYTLLGCAFGAVMCYYPTYATMIVPAKQVPISTAIVMFGSSIGMFCSTYIPFGLMSIAGCETITGTLPICAAILGVGCVCGIFFALRERHFFKDGVPEMK